MNPPAPRSHKKVRAQERGSTAARHSLPLLPLSPKSVLLAWRRVNLSGSIRLKKEDEEVEKDEEEKKKKQKKKKRETKKLSGCGCYRVLLQVHTATKEKSQWRAAFPVATTSSLC